MLDFQFKNMVDESDTGLPEGADDTTENVDVTDEDTEEDKTEY